MPIIKILKGEKTFLKKRMILRKFKKLNWWLLYLAQVFVSINDGVSWLLPYVENSHKL